MSHYVQYHNYDKEGLPIGEPEIVGLPFESDAHQHHPTKRPR